MAKKISRRLLTLGVVTVIGAVLTYAFWPRPVMVDIGAVKREPMVVTIDEEGRTRVHDTYVVATPVAGRLLRVAVEPGDPVIGGESVLAEMLPANPGLLDIRNRTEARADVTAAEAALRLARAQRKQAVADRELAVVDLERTRNLRKTNSTSQAALDRAVREALTSKAALSTSDAAIAMREAELASVRSRFIGIPEATSADTGNAGPETSIPIHSPVTGRVLHLLKESESTLPAGTPIVEIGNIADDLEVLVELLSSDAVQVAPGDRVIITGWGGANELQGTVERVDPWGFTKVSALGVEEQRVNTIIRFTNSPEARAKLGHGFRVEVKIVTWEDKEALSVPSSALFRDGGAWAVFVVGDGTATLRQIEIGKNNGTQAQVSSGLKPGEQVVLYPSSGLAAGDKVAKREIK